MKTSAMSAVARDCFTAVATGTMKKQSARSCVNSSKRLSSFTTKRESRCRAESGKRLRQQDVGRCLMPLALSHPTCRKPIKSRIRRFARFWECHSCRRTPMLISNLKSRVAHLRLTLPDRGHSIDWACSTSINLRLSHLPGRSCRQILSRRESGVPNRWAGTQVG